MNWHARLAERRGTIFQKGAGDSLSKLTEGAFGSFVSNPDGRSEKNVPTDVADLRTRLLHLADAEGLPAAIAADLHADDVTACYGLPDATLRTYLRALQRSAHMEAGNIPGGYTQAAHCDGCGPVLLWHGAPTHLRACPWCFRKKAGKAIPRP